MNPIFTAIDWISVKLNIPGAVLLFMDVGALFKIFAVAATLSTLCYNGIKIYKELKSKK